MIGFVEKYNKELKIALEKARVPVEDVLIRATQVAMRHICMRFVQYEHEIEHEIDIRTGRRCHYEAFMGFRNPVLVIEYEKEGKKYNVLSTYTITKRELIRAYRGFNSERREYEFVEYLHQRIMYHQHFNLRQIAEKYGLDTKRLRELLNMKEEDIEAEESKPANELKKKLKTEQLSRTKTLDRF